MKNTILLILNNFIVYTIDELTISSSTAEYNKNLIVQFITKIIKTSESDENTIFKGNLENDFRNVANYKWDSLNINKKLRECEKIKNEIQIKNNKRDQIERYFDVVDRQLQYTMTKKIMKSEAIIIAAMKEHEHNMQSLELDFENCLSKIEQNNKNNETIKNNLIIIRNDLKSKKASLINKYDSEMMEKYKKENELNTKIKIIEDNIYQLQESISRQLPFYNEVIIEKEIEYDRIWHEKLYEIQRKIAVRKIQIHFRRYLNYIKTRDNKRNKKGQSKKPQSKIKSAPKP